MFGKMLCSVALAAALAAPVWAESTTTRVTFGDGATGTAVTGQVAGQDTADFTLDGSQGQRLSVQMITNNPSSQFDIYAPGTQPGQSPALFTGSSANREATLTLPASGSYVIRAYLAPGAGGPADSARFSLTIDLGGTPQKAVTAPAAPAPAPSAPPAASGALSGGPASWRVTGIAGRLNIRAEASTGAAVVATAGEGDILRNRGCKPADGRTWCQVETTGATPRTGWAANDFLREGAAPGTAPVAATTPAPVPDRVTASTRPPVPAQSKPLPSSATPPENPAVTAAKPAPKPQQRHMAKGSLPCSTALGMPTRDCAYGVTRGAAGAATVTISQPGGGTREIRFDKGQPVARQGQTTERRGNLTVVNIGNERYEIPDAVIFGG